jgi:hypothetical protein
MFGLDPKNIRGKLLPESGWRAWEKPQPLLEIDNWVAKKHFERDILPNHWSSLATGTGGSRVLV